MSAVAGSLYLVSTVAFGLTAIVVGIRLVGAGRAAGRAAEWFLGMGILLTAGLGYGVMMIGLIGRNAWPDAGGVGVIFTAMTALGWVFHNLGVMSFLRFTVMVFRAGERWARWLVIGLGIVLWSGWGGYVALGGLVAVSANAAYWVAFAVIGSYPLWMAAEAWRYYRLMRRRLVLGLADPVVTNRFLLWTLASLSMAASIWIASVPALAGAVPGSSEAVRLRDVTMLLTAGFGTTTVCIYWLTFFPPVWYRRRLERSASDGALSNHSP